MSDYMSRIVELIDKRTSNPDGYVAREVADSVVAYLRAKEPDLLAAFLDSQASTLIWKIVQNRDAASRNWARQQEGRRSFAAAAKRAETGDMAALTPYLDWPCVVDTANTRKRLGDLTAGDLKYVSDGYKVLARTNAMHAAFFSKLAEKVGSDTVKDHYTEDQLARMFNSFR